MADEHGEFTWALAPPTGPVRLELRAALAGHANPSVQGHFWPGESAPTDWRVHTLPLDFALTGTVMDGEGEAVAGALVRVRWHGFETRTDSAGRFALEVPVSIRELSLEVHAAGFANRVLLPVWITGSGRELGDIVLAPETRVTGAVLDEGGRPIPGARVMLAQMLTALPPVNADERGTFDLGMLPSEVGLPLAAEAPGHQRVVLRLEEQHLAGTPLEFRLARAMRAAGRVTGPDGRPVEGAGLHLEFAHRIVPPPEPETWTDGSGRFQLSHSGARALWVRRAGFPTARFALEDSSDTLDLELQLEAAGYLGGVVLDPGGVPVPHAWVAAIREGDHTAALSVRSSTGRDGRFRLQDLPPGRIRITVLRENFARLEYETDRLNRDDLVLPLAPAAALAGRVIDAQSGAPLEDFAVSILPFDAGQGHTLADTPASWSRGVRFEGVRDGTWRLEDAHVAGLSVRVVASAEGYAPASAEPVFTRTDADPDDLVLALAQHVRVRGWVLAAEDGPPLAGASVQSRHVAGQHWPEGQPLPAAITDSNGFFELAGLPLGPIELSIEHPDHPRTMDGPFETLAGTTLDRTITMGSGARITGLLLDGTGSPRIGETVALRGLEGPAQGTTREAVSADDGSFHFERLPAGAYHLSWSWRSESATATDLLTLVHLAQSEEHRVELAPRGRTRVRGQIDFDGALPGSVAVTLMPFDPDAQSSQPGPSRWATSSRGALADNGDFQIDDVEPGLYILSTFFNMPAGGFAAGSIPPFEVPSSGSVDVVITVRIVP